MGEQSQTAVGAMASAAVIAYRSTTAYIAAKLATKADDVADVVHAIKGADKAGDVVNAVKGADKGTDVVQSVAAGNRLDNAAEAGVVGSRVDSTAGTVSTHVDNSAVPAKPKSIIGGEYKPEPGCPLKSFTATTLVLMADGTRKPIADVRIGDQVTSYDPGTDTQSVQTVTATWPHDDVVVTLTLGDGSQVETTASHPWWVESRRSYIRTDHLVSGDQVLTADGSTLTVAGMSDPQGRQQVWNLTITGPHTYYVGQTDILVHNCGPSSIPGRPYTGPSAPAQAFAHLEKNHTLDPIVASNRLHRIKESAGLGAADPVVIGRTGDVYDARTGEFLDSLTNPNLGGTKR